MPVNRAQTRFVYAFGGYSRRDADSAGFFRRALDVRNWPQIYPQGFLPLIEPTVVDASGEGGIRGVSHQWAYDFSAGYGHNSFDFAVGNSLNVSLGPVLPPKTQFDAGTLVLNQFVANADLTRRVSRRVVRRADQRRVRRRVPQRELPDQRRRAGLVPRRRRAQPGVRRRAAIGAQVFPGFRPSNEVNASRHSFAGYVDVEGDVLKWLRLGGAVRGEHYSDFGGTIDGKFTARVQVGSRVIVCAGRRARASARRRSGSRSSRRPPPTSSISETVLCPSSR